MSNEVIDQHGSLKLCCGKINARVLYQKLELFSELNKIRMYFEPLCSSLADNVEVSMFTCFFLYLFVVGKIIPNM